MQDTIEQLPFAQGDVLVEAVGSQLRFWLLLNDRNMRHVATSQTFHRCGRVLNWHGSSRIDPAPDLTMGRVYNHRDRAAGAALVRRYFPDAGTVHFAYSGLGPSGTRLGSASERRYSIKPTQDGTPAAGD